MEDLTDFIANVVEFLVGGLLFSLALGLLLVSVAAPDGFDSGPMDRIDGGSSSVGLAFVALAYAVGVVAESLARFLFEPLLDRATVGRPEFAAKARTTTAPRGIRKLLMAGTDRTVDHKLAATERDRQRVKVMQLDVPLHSEVQGQLKRLRLERVFALSLAVAAVACVVRGEWLWAVIAVAATAILVGLVKSRCGRYCGAIIRNYKVVMSDVADQVAGNAAAASGS